MHKLIILSFMLIVIGILFAEPIEVLFACGDWEPYVGPNLPSGGPVAELIKAICKEAEIIPNIKFYPWPRTELMVENGEVFAAFPYALNSERKYNFKVSEPLYFVENSIMYYSKNPKTKNICFKDIKDLRKYRIGVQNGSFIEKELKKSGITCESTTLIDNSIKKLKVGRIDLIIDGRLVLLNSLEKVYPHETSDFLICHKPFFVNMPNGLIISEKYSAAEEILKRFNHGLYTLKSNRQYDKLLKKLKLDK